MSDRRKDNIKNIPVASREKTQFKKGVKHDGKKISAGMLKGKVGRELALAILQLPAGRGSLLSEINKLLKGLGMEERTEITFEQAIHFQKLLLSFRSKSENVRLFAAESLLNRALGLPKQVQEVTNYTPTVAVNVQDSETKDAIAQLKEAPKTK